MIRFIAKLFAVTVVLITFLPVAPVRAQAVAFVSASGTGTACTQTAPCGSITTAFEGLPIGGRIVCMTPTNDNVGLLIGGGTYVFDCPSTTWTGQLALTGGVVKFQHVNFSGLGTIANIIKATGGGTLIFDECVLEDIAGVGLDIEPTAQFNLVIKNSRISNNAGDGVLIRPAAGGSVTAAFDGVTLVENTGGGLKTDSANGPVTVDIYNSTVTNNNGVGVNGRSGGFLNMVSIKNSVISENSAQGVQANGANVGITVQTTLLDQNTGGATSVEAGGHISTYGNNSIIGSSGSGFTGTALLQ
jgi:hypothetical protein